MFYCLLCILSFALSLSFCFIFNADLNLWPLVLKATTVLTCATTLFIFNLYFISSFSSIWVTTWKPPLTVTYNCCKHLKITIAIKPNLGHTEQLLLVVLCQFGNLTLRRQGSAVRILRKLYRNVQLFDFVILWFAFSHVQ